jgi:hypothetical protein
MSHFDTDSKNNLLLYIYKKNCFILTKSSNLELFKNIKISYYYIDKIVLRIVLNINIQMSYDSRKIVLRLNMENQK